MITRDTDEARTLNLRTTYLGGEKTQVDRFDGGDKMKTTTTTTNDDEGVTVLTEPDAGDAIVVETITVADDTDTITVGRWHFNLSQVIRDKHSSTHAGAGFVNQADVEVVVDGSTVPPVEFELARVADTEKAIAEGTGLGCGVGFQSTPATSGTLECMGNGHNRVTLFRDPSDGFKNVVITYKFSEYKFAAETPIRLAGTRFFHGKTSYANASTQVNIDTAGPGSITPTSGINGSDTGEGFGTEYVVIDFAYHVMDQEDELVTFSSATAGERRLDLTETSAASNVFRTKVALFNQTDYQAITTEAGNEVNDVGTPAGGEVVITIAEMMTGFNRMTGEAPDQTRVYDETLKARVTAAIAALRIVKPPKTNADIAASTLVDRLIQVAHGDTMTIAYPDSSPAGTIVKTAEVDLEAPEVTLIGPVDGLFSNSTAHQLNVDVVDDGAGVEKENIKLVADGMRPWHRHCQGPHCGWLQDYQRAVQHQRGHQDMVCDRNRQGGQHVPAKNDEGVALGRGSRWDGRPRTTPSSSLWTPAPRSYPEARRD